MIAHGYVRFAEIILFGEIPDDALKVLTRASRCIEWALSQVRGSAVQAGVTSVGMARGAALALWAGCCPRCRFFGRNPELVETEHCDHNGLVPDLSGRFVVT
ncbi:hypothetical protein GCM10027563_48450 [Parasphingorhabdus pacifica]